MSPLHAAWRAAGPKQATPVLAGPGWQVGALAGPTRVVVSARPGGPEALTADLAPATVTIEPTAGDSARHWLRLADGTVRPLAKAPGPLALEPGDSYVAVVTGVAPDPALSIAAARFIHLRDYFNADKLAGALLAELAGQEGEAASGMGVLVVECR